MLTQRAFELVRTEVGVPRLPVTLVGFVPVSAAAAAEGGGDSLDDLALMRAIPEMQVFCPVDREELREALPVIVASGRPAYVRYTAAEPAVEHLERFAIGRAQVIASEDGVSIVSCGPSLRVADAVRPAELVVTLESSPGRGGLYTILAETCLKHRLAPRVLPLRSGRRSFASSWASSTTRST